MNGLDAMLILGGGVRSGGELPMWTRRRLDQVIEKRSQAAYVILLSAGTTHKPPPLDANGHPIFESVAAAHYLVEKGINPAKILVETSSYDTIGNVFFSRMIHIEPLQLKRLLVITSEFHMARTKATFEWIYGLKGLPQDVQLSFKTVSDAGIETAVLQARKQKEARSLKALLNTANKIRTINSFHRWLFQEHGAYAVAAQIARESGQILETY